MTNRNPEEIMRELMIIEGKLNDPIESKGKKTILKSAQRKLYREYIKATKKN